VAIGFAAGFAATLVYWFPEEPAVASCGAGHCAVVGYTALVTAAFVVGLFVGAAAGLLVHAATLPPAAADDETVSDPWVRTLRPDSTRTPLHVAVRTIRVVPARASSAPRP
jgi:hypothetical protein